MHVLRGQTVSLGIVEGELRLGNNATIQASNGKKVTVAKGVYLEGKAYVNCDLECESIESEVFISKTKEARLGSERARMELTGRFAGKLEVNGNLSVRKKLSVSHTVHVKGTIDASDIDIGGKVQADIIRCNNIRVGGQADVQSRFEATTVDVGGKVSAPGAVQIGDLHVGGEAEVGGGTISGNIRVGGKFSSKSQLEFGELLVYGKGNLPGGCKGHKISTFGRLEVSGNLTCEIIEVAGVVEIDGDCSAKYVEVGGRLEASGSLDVSDELLGNGVIEIGHDLKGTHLRVSGKLEAGRVVINEEADISGKLETKNGLRAKLLNIRSGSHCEGILIGEHVDVGKSADLSYGTWGPYWSKWSGVGGAAKVDDVYAKEVTIGSLSRASRVFGERVKLEQGAAVNQVIYTIELKTDLGAVIREHIKKVTDLPNPPP